MAKAKGKNVITRKGSKINKKELVQLIVQKKTNEKSTTQTLIKFLSESPYYYKIAQCYKLIKEADVYIARLYKDWNINALEQVLNDLAQQKETAAREGNNKLVLEITKEENKVKSLYTEKVEISGALKIETIKLVEIKKNE